MIVTNSVQDDSSWHVEHTTEANARPQTIWTLFRDVAGWKLWNPGVANSQLDGPFAIGTWFTMTPTGGEPLRSQLLDVRENECFVDETRVGELVVTVQHRLTALSNGRTRISYALSAEGPGATEIGPLVAADFPDVLASLRARVSEARP